LSDFNNFQLISTGNLFGKTIIVEPNYSGAYEIFRVTMFSVTPNINNAVYALWFNNQNDAGRYTNMNSVNTNYAILSNDVTNKVSSLFTTDLTFFWPATGSTPQTVTLTGFSTYASGASIVRYQVAAVASIDAAGGGLPSPFFNIADIANNSQMGGNAARYNLFGISGFGAATI
jgi:hypothetical protein